MIGIIAFLLLSLTASAHTDDVTSRMKFRYVSSDGTFVIPCGHERIRDLPDWKVICAGSGLRKNFTAHFIYRETHRDTEPKTWMELLYWVTEAGEPAPRFQGTSASFALRKGTDLQKMSLMQSVENDYAVLELRYEVPALRP